MKQSDRDRVLGAIRKRQTQAAGLTPFERRFRQRFLSDANDADTKSQGKGKATRVEGLGVGESSSSGE